jgi:hypothetical protein
MPMEPDLEVDVDALHRCAADLTGTASRIAGGPAEAPPLGVQAFGWAAARALVDLEAAAGRHLDGLAEAVAGTGRRMTATADEYDAADVRAAGRLRAL